MTASCSAVSLPETMFLGSSGIKALKFEALRMEPLRKSIPPGDRPTLKMLARLIVFVAWVMAEISCALSANNGVDSILVSTGKL
eukprot:14710809-Heterocapsa_arctica.AAC.1